jgi:hypothetical protein
VFRDSAGGGGHAVGSAIGGATAVSSALGGSLSSGQISPEVELDHFFTSLIRKDAAGGLTLLTNTGAEGACGGGRLSPPMGPSPAYSLPPSPFRNFLGCLNFILQKLSLYVMGNLELVFVSWPG